MRIPTEADAFAWHRVFDDPEVMEFHGGSAAELSVYQEMTARQRAHAARHGFCLYTLLDPAESPGTNPGTGTGPEADADPEVGAGRAVIGFTGAQPWPHDWGPAGEIEIGWRLGRAHWGHGYATAAARLAVERVREAGVPHVVAMVADGNARSVAVTERLGMTLAERFTSPSGRTALCFRLPL
ncbi:N-acetyltransferase [Streptomyces sp. AJS327]|uniref:GNAT family N-acetyltransferase n=1 Tax=Streptomyces sp. AJS327 TaxID=2545265 RepID=UPI0015E02FF3|nr:GNAT family N-acetyltransferase [Streptomyces sp. AJS327]MBA0053988.1 N-acetyltransferase [Streptomyces sp. AJS327]